ncbi:MAG: LutC/YkgG family protein [Thermoguttaceae bacterium]|jgi:L-lactate dehydrogenase complex protein LldG
MDSRTIILNRIKKALNDIDKTNLQEPELPEIWPVTGKSKEELATVFAENLKSVAGQAEICKDWDDAVVKIGETMNEIASSSEKDAPFQLGVYSSELAQKTARKLLENNGDWTDLNVPENPNIDPNDYESMAASLVTPFALLADTGSCAIEGHSAFERLLCYLSPVCFVVAKASQLRENLPHAWSEIQEKMEDPQQRGEIVLVTGPSRTADIEKKLVLGVHGPQRLVVFLIQNE